MSERDQRQVEEITVLSRLCTLRSKWCSSHSRPELRWLDTPQCQSIKSVDRLRILLLKLTSRSWEIYPCLKARQ